MSPKVSESDMLAFVLWGHDSLAQSDESKIPKKEEY